jgi:hypothetical protein
MAIFCYLNYMACRYYLIAAPKAIRIGPSGQPGGGLPLSAKQWGMVVLDSGTPHVIVPGKLFDLISGMVCRNPQPHTRSQVRPVIA